MGRLDGFEGFNERVQPEALERRFDTESAWDDEDLEVHAKFMRVKWDSSYADAVDWTSQSMRDNYFAQDFGDDEIVLSPGEIGPQWNHKELMKWDAAQGKYAGKMRINCPAESVGLFNYLAVTYKYPQPVPGPEPREEKYFFFVQAVNPLSPNATEVYLSLDVWTTYKFLVGINGISLVQGHYPVSQISATQFLNNPIASEIDLTADEPDLPRLKNRTASANLISLQGSSPRVCIATTANLDQQPQLWEPSHTGTPPAGWWKGDTLGWDESTPVADVAGAYVNGAGPGLRVYSMTPADYTSFMTDARNLLPQFVKTIKAIYVLPSNMIVESSATYTMLGKTFRQVTPQSAPVKVGELGINKALFGYEAANADFAKLYSDQFAEISVSDNQGKSASISLTSLAGNLDVYSRANSAFPFLKLEAFIDGIGGKGAKNYSVAPWGTQNATIFNSQFQDYSFQLEVPVYGVYIDPRQDAAMENSIKEWQAKQNRDFSYEKSTRNIDTDFSITDRSRAVSSTNAIASINTANTNSLRSIGLTKDNADQQANAAHTSGAESISTDNLNSTASITTAYDTSLSATNSSYGIAEASRSLNFTNNGIQIQTNYDIAELNMAGSDILQSYNKFNAEVSHALGVSSAALGLTTTTMSTAVGMVATGAALGGPAGALGGAVAGMANLGVNFYSTMNQVDLDGYAAVLAFHNSEMSNSVGSSRLINGNVSFNYDNAFEWPGVVEDDPYLFNNPLILNHVDAVSIFSVASRVAQLRQTIDEEILSSNNTQEAANNLAARNNSNAIALSLRNTDNANLGRSIDTAESINDRSRTVSLAVNTRTENVNTVSANASQSTDLANNTRLNGASGLVNDNAVEKRSNARVNRNAERAIAVDNRLAEKSLSYTGEAGLYGNFSGPSATDAWGLRGLTLTVNTISKSAEKVVGDYFRLKGYSMNSAFISLPILSVMQNWTYWKADDIWLNAGAINDANEIIIRNMFTNGVTLWKNPANVKNVNLPNGAL